MPVELFKTLTWDRGKEMGAARRHQGLNRRPGLLL